MFRSIQFSRSNFWKNVLDARKPKGSYVRRVSEISLDWLKSSLSITNKNLLPIRYNDIRIDDDIASSEDEFLSDIDDLDLTNSKWKPPESELRRQVGIILGKIHPLENEYSSIIDDMLCEYLHYIHSKQRSAKIKRIVDCVNKPLTQQEKTKLLIQREIDDKKLNRKFYYSTAEPAHFVSLCLKRKCGSDDRKFFSSIPRRN